MEITVRGATMCFEQYGSGDRVLLLLHGWGGGMDNWLPVIRDFQKDMRVVAVDFPAHGKSPAPDTPWSVTEYMEITASLIREFDIAGCDIMAHSFGGRVAILLAATYPELVGKLILTGCAGLPPRLTAGVRVKRVLLYAARAVAGSRLARRLFGQERLARVREKMQYAFGSADYKKLSPAMRETFNRVIRQDLTEYLPRIQASTLIIWGRNDTATPLWMGEAMEKAIPDAGLVVFEDAGHFAYLEKYADFQVIARRFLNG